MRKFLSLLLAAVLICTSVILPASAEELMENEQLVAIQDEQISVQPRAIGDQTTYHICFASDGRMLTASGSSLYTNQYIENNTSMQWIFEEYLSYHGYYVTYVTYVIRSASNSSQVLSLSSSGNLCTATWGASGYTQIWIIDGSGIAADSNVDGVGEYYLYSSGAYPYSVSTTTSASSASDIELILPHHIAGGGTMSIDGVALAPNTTTDVPQPTYTASMMSYYGDPWLLYSSNNTSICTVDNYGRITGISLGSTTITVTHKITRVTGTCTVHVVNISDKSVTLLYPASSSASTYTSVFETAASDFLDTFLISFTCDAIASQELDSISASCTHDSDTICDSTCGPLAQCSIAHHKSDSRIVGVMPPAGTPTSDFIIRYVDHVMCTYYENEHFGIYGEWFADTPDIIVTYNSSLQCTKTTLHEISHAYGTLDNYEQMNCSSQACVMASATRGWCSNCYNIIMNNR